MTDFYNGKDPADAITYSHKFVEKLTGLRGGEKQLTFRDLWACSLLSSHGKVLDSQHYPLRSLDISGTHPLILWKEAVFINPRVNFGAPTVRATGIKTSIIYARYKGGESVTEIAEDYDISEAEVKAAIEFEEVMK